MQPALRGAARRLRRARSPTPTAGVRRRAHSAAVARTDLVHFFDHEVSGFGTLGKNSHPESSDSCPIVATSDGMRVVAEVPSLQESKLSAQDQQQLAHVRAGYEQLRAIQNVGEKNAELLLAAGCTDRKSLAEKLLAEHVLDDDEKAARWLKSEVGIKRYDYAMSIIREARRERSQWDRQVTMCVEGNISVGKTTFLEKVCNTSKDLAGRVQVVPEPIAQWTNMPDGQHNLLECFYKDPKEYGYMFQNYVFCTRVEQEGGHTRSVDAQQSPLRLLERSVFSDLRVFVRAGVQEGYLSELQRDVYLSSIKPIIKSVPSLQPDAFVYLRAKPQTCYDRLLQRSREEENGVKLEYLERLHEYHEEWMRGDQVSTLDASGLNVIKFNSFGSPFLPATDAADGVKGELACSDRKGPRQPTSLLGVPALVLDCEPDIVTDPEAKEEYSRALHTFWQYVAKERQDRHEGEEKIAAADWV
jgi:deoxyadenosine/deoxycytidine kinase